MAEAMAVPRELLGPAALREGGAAGAVRGLCGVGGGRKARVFGARRRGRARLALLLTAGILAARVNAGGATDGERGASAFFDRLDVNDDGQIELNEASAYIRKSFDAHPDFDTKGEVDRAAKQLLASIDGNDEGSTVSEDELLRHLKGMLKPHDVEEWVKLGLRQPKFAPVFAAHAVTGLDFPHLAGNNGKALNDDLGIESPLIRKQFVRALKRRMLRLGSIPGTPAQLTCAPLVGACGVRLAGNAPETVGVPPLHSYEVVGRSAAHAADLHAAPWELALGIAHSSLDDDDGEAPNDQAGSVVKEHHTVAHNATDVLIPPTAPGKAGQQSAAEGAENDVRLFEYRVRAWSSFGHGPWSAAVPCAPLAQPCYARLADEQAARRRALKSQTNANASEEGVKEDAPLYGQMWSIAVALVVGLAIRQSSALARVLGMLHLGNPANDRVREEIVVEALRPETPSHDGGGSGAGGGTGGAKRAVVFASPVRTDTANGDAGTSGQKSGERARTSSEQRRRASLTRFDLHRLEEARKELLAAEGAVNGGAPIPGEFGDTMPPPPSPPSPHHVADRTRQRALSAQALARVNSRESLNGTGAASDDENVGLGVVTPSRQNDGEFTFSDAGGAGPTVAAAGQERSSVDESRRGRECCRVHGCPVRFDRWYKMKDMRARGRRHFCMYCQQAMCEEHTRVSPHGRVGSCGLESSCVCESCFRSLDQETQHMLSATDKLKPIRHAASFVSALKLKAATSAPVPATEAFVRAQQRWRGALHRLARRAPPLSRTPSSSSL